MSQAQIQALTLLSMGATDLREEILNAARENPALEIGDGIKTQAATDDYFASRKIAKQSNNFLSEKYNARSEKTEKFQAMIEASPDTRKTLREHLMEQLNIMRLSDAERSVGEKLINNLDRRGFHILSPPSLIDKEKGESEQVLAKMISVVQGFEPAGICCVNIEESLLIQAKNTGNAPPLAIFFLSGNLQILSPPLPARVKKKILEFKKNQKKLDFARTPQAMPLEAKFLDEEKIAEAIAFIKTLNPHPAADFGTESINYVSADISVTKITEHYDEDNFDKGIVVADEQNTYQLKLLKNNIPPVRLAKNFVNANKACAEQLQKATQFINNLEYRASSLLALACHIVKAQKDFFAHGAGHLAPLTRKSMAETLSLHVSTISRLADSKYILCEWGLFPLKYFFESGVQISDTESKQNNDEKTSLVAREKILLEIKNILESHPTAGENSGRISDAKLAGMLKERGVNIARRTVAKYRALLDIGSSYDR